MGWQETEFNDGFTESTFDVGGISDVSTGFNYLWRAETKCAPAIITSFDVTAPTGNAFDPLLLTDSGLGSGVWAFSTSALMIRTLDPVVAFWGGGYRYTLENDFRTNRIDLGDQIFYSCGVGFAANERVTLSTSFQGSFITDSQVNGVNLDGSGFDVASIRLAATMLNCKRITEPFVEFGITDRAPSAQFGVLFTR